MTTTYICFPDESTGMAALDAAGLTTTNEDGDTVVLTASHTHALDVVGPIYKGGTYDPDTGEVLIQPTLLNGWHVNYVGDLPNGWDAYLVEPEQPARVFAGQSQKLSLPLSSINCPIPVGTVTIRGYFE